MYLTSYADYLTGLLIILLGASLVKLLPDVMQEIDYLVVIKWLFFEEEVEWGHVYLCLHAPNHILPGIMQLCWSFTL